MPIEVLEQQQLLQSAHHERALEVTEWVGWLVLEGSNVVSDGEEVDCEIIHTGRENEAEVFDVVDEDGGVGS